MSSGALSVRVAGSIKLCPVCSEPWDDWMRLRQHCWEKHGEHVKTPAR